MTNPYRDEPTPVLTLPLINRTLIVTAATQALAQQLCGGIAGPAGEGMFLVALSPTGADPATHYISSGWIDSRFDALLTNADLMYAAAQQANIPVTLAQCQDLVSTSTVQSADTESPLTTIVRLSLSFIIPSLGV